MENNPDQKEPGNGVIVPALFVGGVILALVILKLFI